MLFKRQIQDEINAVYSLQVEADSVTNREFNWRVEERVGSLSHLFNSSSISVLSCDLRLSHNEVYLDLSFLPAVWTSISPPAPVEQHAAHQLCLW